MNNKLITSLFTKQIKNITNGVQASRTFTSAATRVTTPREDITEVSQHSTIKKRINLWTQPRSSSTSLMYSFKSRGNCSVVDKPENYFKLAAIGLPTGSFAGLCGKLHVMMNISIYILLFSNPI